MPLCLTHIPITRINTATAIRTCREPVRRMYPRCVDAVQFVIVEAVAGWHAHSLALLSDAGHNLADAAALGFSWYALWIANKPSHRA